MTAPAQACQAMVDARRRMQGQQAPGRKTRNCSGAARSSANGRCAMRAGASTSRPAAELNPRVRSSRTARPRSDAAPADSRPQSTHRRGRRQQHGVGELCCASDSRRRPSQRPALRDQIALAARLHHRAIGQSSSGIGSAMQPLLAAIAAVRDAAPHPSRRERRATPLPSLPRRAKRLASSRRQ